MNMMESVKIVTKAIESQKALMHAVTTTNDYKSAAKHAGILARLTEKYTLDRGGIVSVATGLADEYEYFRVAPPVTERATETTESEVKA